MDPGEDVDPSSMNIKIKPTIWTVKLCETNKFILFCTSSKLMLLSPVCPSVSPLGEKKNILMDFPGSIYRSAYLGRHEHGVYFPTHHRQCGLNWGLIFLHLNGLTFSNSLRHLHTCTPEGLSSDRWRMSTVCPWVSEKSVNEPPNFFNDHVFHVV